jgi:hypothetical protein
MRRAARRSALAIALAACGGKIASTEVDAGAPPPLCCPAAPVPPGCDSREYGGTRPIGALAPHCPYEFATDIPDPAAPGWALIPDSNGCPTWVPPKTPRTLHCAPLDAGAHDG